MIIPLNIVMTYPVYWGKYNLFRDYIQNFYDSVSHKKFIEMFQYRYKNEKIEMEIAGVSFNYEWLLHIGASTKTLASDGKAGYFGEGFKIASLCAHRDYNWNITMSSADWSLTVITEKQQIDGNTIEMLAYDIQKSKNEDVSRLSISPVSQSDFQVFEIAVLSFYYPENPLIGKVIWEGEQGAVYKRSQNEYDINLPYTSEFGRKGAVFCSYQLLGSNPFNLVVCDHNYKQNDRERRSLYTFNVIDVFQNIAYRIDSFGAISMLEQMRRYWGSVPHKKVDIHSWYGVITTLVNRICKSTEAVEIFRKKYPNLLYLDRLYSIREKNRRGQARAWLAQQDKKYVTVQKAFAKLGYHSLENECERNGGFVCDDKPDEKQNEYFEILKELIQNIYHDFFAFIDDVMPDSKIIVNNKASYHGMATVYAIRKRVLNIYGIYVRYTVSEVYLKKTILRKEMFYDALVTYIHELCHMFGGDSSNNFSQALTFAMGILMENSELVNSYKKKWEMVDCYG